ncbi:STM4011 family radical SAM protein [Motilimonas sp. 1_MG-2023]|uniref:STM4011 family radical SAM protein n=1 Tax=Motilimonas TaxID=1914248 RepID=UPI0026E3F1AB|nr:STM4011 family radical SAM protein [Motilimonas sp. 1_MG-2023]MDO6525596.1 STM4011 family radical SAM protein [Motilimonas sp. 1_MG-2023]
MRLDITYRGPLASCNYDCDYCPFAKTFDDAATRAKDKLAIERFVAWVSSRQAKDSFRLLFTPWGEALVRSWYRQALVTLSHLEHVEKVVIQTNMSVAIDWLKQANLNKLALWITYHPSEISLADFVMKTQQLDRLGVSYSVGIVGTKENIPKAKALREQLHPEVYLWVNAFKDQLDYYLPDERDFYAQLDPWFHLNQQNYPSLNRECRASVTSLSMDGEGYIQPCHFVKQSLGNVYQQELHSLLNQHYLCPNQSCDCYIGYRHLPHLKLEKVYGDGLLERIPIKG